MMYFLTLGIMLGLSAGFAPGPLLALVISETLRHGIKAGIRVALAPVVTDLPIVLVTFLVLSALSDFHGILGILSLAGGFFLLAMGYEGVRAKPIEPSIGEAKPKSLAKGVLANALNPHPYLFWLTVGGPTMTQAMDLGVAALLSFLITFYALLIGSKVLMALFVGKSKSLFSATVYLYTMRLLGLALGVLALFLFYDGLKLLGILRA